jgi:hypothetical protein
MTMRPEDDLEALERLWALRARRVAAVRARIEVGGLTRPARDPDERAWLAERGALGPFVEVPHPTPPGEASSDDSPRAEPPNAEHS